MPVDRSRAEDDAATAREVEEHAIASERVRRARRLLNDQDLFQKLAIALEVYGIRNDHLAEALTDTCVYQIVRYLDAEPRAVEPSASAHEGHAGNAQGAAVPRLDQTEGR